MEWKDKLMNLVVTKGPALFGACMIVVAGLLAARYVGALVMRWLMTKEVEPPVRMLIVRLVKLLVVIFSLVIAAGTCGVEVAPLVAGIGVVGVGVSLAMQGVLANLVAGLLIIFTKPFRVGQYIEIIGVQGQVENVELFNTILTHADKSRVVIPNRKIIGEVLHNYGTIRQLELSVGVAYDTEIPQALAIVREVLRENGRVLKEPAPVVGVSTLADSSVNISIKPWTSVNDYGAASAEVLQAVLTKFRQHKVEIPFPQREIRVLNGNGSGAALHRS